MLLCLFLHSAHEKPCEYRAADANTMASTRSTIWSSVCPSAATCLPGLSQAAIQASPCLQHSLTVLISRGAWLLWELMFNNVRALWLLCLPVFTTQFPGSGAIQPPLCLGLWTSHHQNRLLNWCCGLKIPPDPGARVLPSAAEGGEAAGSSLVPWQCSFLCPCDCLGCTHCSEAATPVSSCFTDSSLGHQAKLFTNTTISTWLSPGSLQKTLFAMHLLMQSICFFYQSRWISFNGK